LDTLTPQFLGAFGVVPDGGIFELALDLGQAFFLDIIVKDTPSGHRNAPAYL